MNDQLTVFDSEKEIELIEKDGLYSLTDLWKQSGRNESKTPSKWLMQRSSNEFIEHIKQRKNSSSSVISIIKHGEQKGTFAHWQIALAYAKYLSPELHAKVNQVFKEKLEEDKKYQLPDFSNPAEAARAWADQYEVSQKAIAKLEEARPKMG